MNFNEKEILILVKNVNKTNELSSCYFDVSTNKYRVTYKTIDTEYIYNKENVVIIKNPVKLDANLYRFTTKRGKELFSIKEVYLFANKKKYYYIVLNNEESLRYSEDDIDVKESLLLNDGINKKFDYLKHISKMNDLRNKETNEKILEKRINRINFFDDSALKLYLNQGEIKNKVADVLIFPFGCNNSQYKAVLNAMQNGISIIEGPPGTGKTQTILNIISNILVNDKNVQVVSNNNSAIENIMDKMKKESLDFIIAKLGNSENKDSFIRNQNKKYPDLKNWQEINVAEVYNEIKSKNNQLKLFFEANAKKSYLAEKLKDYIYEREYYLKYIEDNKIGELWIEKCKKIKSDKLLKLLLDIEKNGKLSFFNRIVCCIYRIINIKQFCKVLAGDIIVKLRYLFIVFKIDEIKKEIHDYNLVINDNINLITEVTELSMRVFKNFLYNKFNNRKRKEFLENEIGNKGFLNEYPVVLSTTFSSSANIWNSVFDYLIMDEASQVDIATGALALSTAKSAIIVGDLKQLPNVIDDTAKKCAKDILKNIVVPYGKEFDISFLQSMIKVLPNAARVLLREHYRCHPKIIGFCNKEFYNGNLLIMTEDKNESEVLKCIKTVKGNHETDKRNYRELDVIKEEILPALSEYDNIGVITPYNNQVNIIDKYFREKFIDKNIEVGTIHKFQGREKDVIIISTVDNDETRFIDDKMLNVAISRAKKKLYLVTTGNDSCVGNEVKDFIDYIAYNNFEVSNSNIRSVFDCLYKQYDDLRKEIISRIKIVSQYDSENIMYDLIIKLLNEKFEKCDVVFEYPMNILIEDFSLLRSNDEVQYAKNPFTHVDFLIYHKVTKKPILAIEVDGYTFHKESTYQYQRDIMKNNILQLYNIPLIRFSTKESNIKEKLENKLKDIV